MTVPLSRIERTIVRRVSWPSVLAEGELDLAALATVGVSSESPLYPIDNVFDTQRGPGGSCWVSGYGGAQTVVVAFREARELRSVVVQVEERARTRIQSVALATSRDGGATFAEEPARHLSFSPYGETFREEEWPVAAGSVTHVRLRIVPSAAAASAGARASLTSVVMR